MEKISFLVTLIVFTILLLVCVVYMVLRSKPSYLLRLVSSVIFSICIILVLLCLRLFFFEDSKIFEEITKGEVLAGIVIAIPTITTWYNDSEEKRKDEMKKEVGVAFSKWSSETSEENRELSSKNWLEISRILDKLEVIRKLDNEIELDLNSLFVFLQGKLQQDVKAEKSWREVNSKIINLISHDEESTELFYKLFPSKSLNKLCFVDFDRCSMLKNLAGRPEEISFYKCFFTAKFLENWDFFVEGGTVIFNECVFDESISKSFFKRFLPDQSKIIIKNSLVNDEMDSSRDQISYEYSTEEDTIQDDTVHDSNKHNRDNNGMSESKGNYEQVILEKRDEWGNTPINDLLQGNGVEVIIISDDIRKSINNRIIDALEKKLHLGITKENSKISRSKNYVQEMKEGYLYEWWSWNTVMKDKIDSQFKFFIFAVQWDNNQKDKFRCIIFNRESFEKLMSKKKLSNGDRYFFYFTSPKY
jgi:hypothetical protein